MNYKDIITIEPNKRGGKPYIRRMRLTIEDALNYLASAMLKTEIIRGFSYPIN